MTLTLDCPKCGRQNVLSDDDAVFFYPRFQCLSCGTRLPIPMTPEEYLKRGRETDRDRRVHVDGSGARPQAPLKAVPPSATPGDAG
jgi:hypothetical protein